MKITWKSLFSFSLIILSANVWANTNNLNIEDCHLEGIKSQVKCGTLLVPENYQKPEGEKISINFAILPAIDSSKNKAPLMFLAGGPGQAAVELAAQLHKGFTEIRKTRDLVLVDQRGTGKSHPLQCEDVSNMNIYELIPEDLSDKEVTDCLAQLKGDLSQFTSENSIRDFDAVRAALGHEKINIYGGSYGTRAGLVYMRLFPNHLRSVVLDSVGPIEVPIGTFGLSSARSFNLLLENCKNDEACHSAYPELENEFLSIIALLEQSPITLEVSHPRLATKTQFKLSKSKFIGNIRMQLYSMDTRTLVPLVIHQAYLGNYQPFLGLVAMGDGNQSMYMGLTFNIVCNEDIPKVTPAMFATDADNSFGGSDSHGSWLKVCPLWPKYQPSEDFYQSVTANIPTLILSGNLDPVTPPSNGDKSAATIENNHHIVSKSNAHIVASSTCAIKIIDEFLEGLEPKNLDESCLDELPKASFMTSLNGSI